MGQRLAGKTALVTAAGQGIGRAVAEAFAREGAAVVATDIHDGSLAELARVAGIQARRLDVTDAAAIQTLAAELGAVQVLFNGAGFVHAGSVLECTEADWDFAFTLNVRSMYRLIQAVLPAMLEHGGSIVTIASNAGLMGQPWSAAYCASKGGVVQLTRALADEYLYTKKVRVNCVAPGGMATPFQELFHQLPEGADATRLGKLRTPLGNAKTEEVAALIAFVASDEGRYMTGSIVSMDGGLTI